MSLKWDGYSSTEFEYTGSEHYRDGDVLHFYMSDMPLRDSHNLLPGGLENEQSAYGVLSKIMKWMKVSFKDPIVFPSHSPFGNRLEDIVAIPWIFRAIRECKKNEDRLDEILDFMKSNGDVIENEPEVWSATEDWILSYLDDVSTSEASIPRSYARSALRHYRAKVPRD